MVVNISEIKHRGCENEQSRLIIEVSRLRKGGKAMPTEGIESGVWEELMAAIFHVLWHLKWQMYSRKGPGERHGDLCQGRMMDCLFLYVRQFYGGVIYTQRGLPSQHASS